MDKTCFIHRLLRREGITTNKTMFKLGGIVEGFYGRPWSHRERIEMIEYIASLGMNAYIYAPKDDPYLREQWREPYPPKEYEKLSQLISSCRSCGIAFIFSISPGKSMAYSSETDFELLYEKYKTAVEAGATWGMILFDDIPPGLVYKKDQQAFSNDYGLAQSVLANRLFKKLKEDFGISGFILCPTEYSGLRETEYKSSIREYMNRDIQVVWTGPAAFTKKMDPQRVQMAKKLYGHPLIFWDNFPVNDADRDTLCLAPLTNRSEDLYANLEGYFSNPMIQPECSKIPLATVADYMCNPAGYIPEESMYRVIGKLGGEYAQDLKILCENCSWHRTMGDNSEKLYRCIELMEYEDGLLALNDYFSQIGMLPQALENIQNTALMTEITEWIPKIKLTAELGKCSVKKINEALRLDISKLRQEYKKEKRFFAGDIVLYLSARAEAENMEIEKLISQMLVFSVHKSNFQQIARDTRFLEKSFGLIITYDCVHEFVDLLKTKSVGLKDRILAVELPDHVSEIGNVGIIAAADIVKKGNSFNAYYDRKSVAEDMKKLGVNTMILNDAKDLESSLGSLYMDNAEEFGEYIEQAAAGILAADVGCLIALPTSEYFDFSTILKKGCGQSVVLDKITDFAADQVIRRKPPYSPVLARMAIVSGESNETRLEGYMRLLGQGVNLLTIDYEAWQYQDIVKELCNRLNHKQISAKMLSKLAAEALYFKYKVT